MSLNTRPRTHLRITSSTLTLFSCTCSCNERDEKSKLLHAWSTAWRTGPPRGSALRTRRTKASSVVFPSAKEPPVRQANVSDVIRKILTNSQTVPGLYSLTRACRDMYIFCAAQLLTVTFVFVHQARTRAANRRISCSPNARSSRTFIPPIGPGQAPAAFLARDPACNVLDLGRGAVNDCALGLVPALVWLTRTQARACVALAPAA